MYEVEVLLNSGSGVWIEPGLKASGWETREGDVGSENASCVEENTWPFLGCWWVSEEKREENQPMAGVSVRSGRILCGWDQSMIS